MFALWIIIGIAFSQNVTRLDVQSEECQIYISKFNTKITNITSIVFSGWGQFSTFGLVGGSPGNPLLTFYYFDSFYKDPKYYGLVQQDGKLLNQTCLDLKLWHFNSKSFCNPQQITVGCFDTLNNYSNICNGYPFLATNESGSTRVDSGVRFFQQYLFESDLPQYTIENSNTKYNLFMGFWALSYYLVGSKNDIFTFYFSFTTILQPLNNPDCTHMCYSTPINLFFHPFNFFETQNCSLSFQNCTIKYTTTLKQCTDSTCLSFNTSPQLILNESFYLLISINQTEFKDNYIIDTKAYLQGEGLDHEIIPLSVQNSIKGQSIIQLKSNIVWNNFRILVTSYLISSLNTNQTKTYPINGLTDQISCIFLNSNSTDCPSCDDEQNTNGFARIECKYDYKLTICMILVMMAILV